jgi:hypothetical protein
MGAAVMESSSMPIRIGLVALSLGLSLASYRLVENPVRYNRRLAKRHAYAFVMAGSLAIIGIGISWGWMYFCVREAKTPRFANITRAPRDKPLSLETGGCFANYLDVNAKPCAYANTAGSTTVVLFGDSHAAQWFPALEPIALRKGWRLMSLIKQACAPVDAPYFYPALGRVYNECEEWRENALQEIRQIRPVLTVMTSSEGYLFEDDQWQKGISSVLQNLAESSRNVLVIRDTPRPNFDVPACLGRRLWRPSFMSSSPCEFPLSQSPKIYDYYRAFARQFQNVRIADLSSSICPNGICKGEINNVVTYRDSNHLSASFAGGLEGVLTKQIDCALKP